MRIIDMAIACQAGGLEDVQIRQSETGGWTVEVLSVGNWETLTLARGGPRIFSSLDSAVNAIEQGGWEKPITIKK